MWLQVRWELTMSAFVFLGPAQTKQYLGNISIYDFSEGPGHGHISPFEKLGNVPVVLLCGDDQRPLDIWALFFLLIQFMFSKSLEFSTCRVGCTKVVLIPIVPTPCQCKCCLNLI